MKNQTVFLVHYTVFECKPGHMYISCKGIFTSWEVAFRKALKISEDEEDEKNKDKKLPTTKQELSVFLPKHSCIWEFKNNCIAEWWDNSGLGSHLISVSQQQIEDNDNSDDSENES